MSVSAVSTPASFQPNPQDSSFRSAFQQLTGAISSGDLQTAQSAYASLSQLQQQSGGSTQGPLGQLLSTLGSDLSSGDISGAQSALQAFQKAHTHHHHHKPAASGGDDSQPAPSSASAPSASSNLLDITA